MGNSAGAIRNCLEVALTEETMARIGINPRQDGTTQLDLAELFGNDHPVTIEIGSGKGRFLLQEALAEQGRNFLGIEKSLHYFRLIVDRVQRSGRTNIRVINHDAILVLETMIPGASVSEIHIYFPDPWPRPRERKRRLIAPALLREVERVLVPGGGGLYVTDHKEYFEKSVPLFDAVFETVSGEVPRDSPARTNYEAKYREEGRPIYQIAFRLRSADEKNSPARTEVSS